LIVEISRPQQERPSAIDNLFWLTGTWQELTVKTVILPPHTLSGEDRRKDYLFYPSLNTMGHDEANPYPSLLRLQGLSIGVRDGLK
jgi:hypothetical protein